MDEKGLGNRLQLARKAAGYTQQELCQKTGLSYSTLAKIERGAIKSPSIFTIQQIAAALNTSVDQLIAGESASSGKKQSKNGVTFVYFDVNGCLVRYYQRAFAAIAADTGVSSDLVEATYLQYNDAVCKGVMSLEEFNTTLARCFEVTEFDWSQYYLSAIDTITETTDLLNWTAQHYRVGLLTNIMPELIPAMIVKGLIPDISYDVIIESSEVNLIKPDPAIYDLALNEAGCEPHEILFVDDTKLNIAVAERAGWQTLWFNDYEPKESVARIKDALAY